MTLILLFLIFSLAIFSFLAIFLILKGKGNKTSSVKSFKWLNLILGLFLGLSIIIVGTIVYIGFRFRTSSHSFAELSNQFPRESLNLAPCDINGDGKCNDADIELLNKVMGTYRGQNDYVPLADLNADGVINDNDKQMLLKLLDQSQADETANWKTYTDTNSEFSLKYPDTYFKFQGDPKLLGFFVATSAPQGGDSPKFFGANDVWLNAGNLLGVSVTSLDQYLKSHSEYTNAQKIPVAIGGISGLKVIYTFMVGPAEPMRPQYVCEGLVLKNNKLYSIAMASWSKNALDSNQTIFGQILSTFKFLD